MPALTQSRIETAQVGRSPVDLRDSKTRGLLCRVHPSGRRVFYVEWKRGQRYLIGDYPITTLARARAVATEVLADYLDRQRHSRAGGPGPVPELVLLKRGRDAADKGNAVETLRDLISGDYGDWAEANRKSGKATRNRLLSAFASVLDTRLADVNPLQLERWRRDRLADGVSPATVNRDFAALRGALSKAVEWGHLGANPMRAVKASKEDKLTRVRYLSADEEKRLRDVLSARDARRRQERANRNAWCKSRGMEPLPAIPLHGYPDHLTPMILLALNTGLRRGELTSLMWFDINEAHKMLTVRSSNAKSGKARHVPLNKEAIRVLANMQMGRETPAPSEKLFDVHSIKTGWKAVAEAAKLKDFRFHDLRHHFASSLVMGGIDLNTVRELLGHSSPVMTLRYAHLAPDHLADAVSVLDKKRVAV
ncbi:MAG: site-specific integrase [Xanthomonadales bacterium]|nr:site-specific integrase [Xanthomonadales bacterium]